MNRDLIDGIFLALMVAAIAAIGALYNRIRALEVEQAKQAIQLSPLWARVQAQISSDLHHPHPRYLEMDTLLEELESLTITPSQRNRLKILLFERSTDMHPDITDSQREKAKLMIVVMDMVVAEAHDSKK